MLARLRRLWRNYILFAFWAPEQVIIPVDPPPPPRATLLTPPETAPVEPAPVELAAPPQSPRRKHRPHKKHDFSFHKLRKDVTEAALAVLDCLDHLRRAEWEYASDDIAALENLWGCDFLLMDRKLGEKLKGGDKWTTVDAKPREMADVVWPVDYAFACFDSLEEEGKPYLELLRITSVTAEQVRGRVTAVMPWMVYITMGWFDEEGHWSASATHYGLVNETWVPIGTKLNAMSKQNRDAINKRLASRIESIFTAHYEWHVAFGTIPGGPRLLLPTNPAGCLQLFKNRDLTEGKTRRDALRHWVEEHWRDGEEDIAFVCHHLRGKTRFTWSGFDCELFVSAYDLAKNEFFKRQAQDWRSQRKHNRVRVRFKSRRANNHVEAQN